MQCGRIKFNGGSCLYEKCFHFICLIGKILCHILFTAEEQDQIRGRNVYFRGSVIFQRIEQIVVSITVADLYWKFSEDLFL